MRREINVQKFFHHRPVTAPKARAFYRTGLDNFEKKPKGEFLLRRARAHGYTPKICYREEGRDDQRQARVIFRWQEDSLWHSTKRRCVT